MKKLKIITGAKLDLPQLDTMHKVKETVWPAEVVSFIHVKNYFHHGTKNVY